VSGALPALLILVGTATAVWTEALVFGGASAHQAALGLGVAIALFLLGLETSSDSSLLRWHPTEARVRRGRAGAMISKPLLAASLCLGAVTFLASGENRFTLLNVTTWTSSVALCLVACWQPPLRAPTWKALRGHLRLPEVLTVHLSWSGIVLLLIVLMGAFLLFYRLGDVPREMQSDHAEKLLDVRDVLDGQHRVFFPRNTGREAFQFYWAALLSPITGVSYLGLKIGTALLACIAIPVTFLFVRTVSGESLGLLSAMVLATSRWLLIVGRRGLRFPFPPLFGAAIYFLLFRAIRYRRRSDFLLCGVAVGVGLYTYVPLRIAPIGVFLCLAVAVVTDVWRLESPRRVWRLLVDSALLFTVTGLIFVPLGRYAWDHPEEFLFRGVSRIAGDTLSTPPSGSLAIFVDNSKNALLMFNWRGDTAWVNNVPLMPFLDPISGGLFVLGCAYAAYRLARFREIPYVYLFLLMFVGTLPSTLSIAFPIENPATARIGLVLPITMLFVAIPVVFVARSVRSLLEGVAGRAAAAASLLLLLGAILYNNYDEYFLRYNRSYLNNSQHIIPIVRTINGFLALGGRREDVHLVPWAYWVDTRSVASEAGDIRWQIAMADIREARKDDGVPRQRLYILNPDDVRSLATLMAWYPDAVRQEVGLPELGGRPYFVTVLVPSGATAKG
jgi:hypothetical protein